MIRKLFYRLRGERCITRAYWPQDFPIGGVCDGCVITRYLRTRGKYFEVWGRRVRS